VSSSLTAALQAYLAADATLTAAASGGVWLEPGPQDVGQPFVVIEPAGGFYEGCDIERSVYVIAAVAPAASVATVRTAANRLEVLLDDNANIRTSLSGFTVLGNWRTSPIDETLEEVSGRWVRVGGEFTLIAEPA
jgi:hypothetical protein